VVGVLIAVKMGPPPVCLGVKKNGEPCQFRGRYGGFCKFHETKDVRDCPICYDVISGKDFKITRCNHVFHKSCLERWTCQNSTCPMCRENIIQGRVVYVNSYDELLPYLNAPVEVRFTARYWDH